MATSGPERRTIRINSVAPRERVGGVVTREELWEKIRREDGAQ